MVNPAIETASFEVPIIYNGVPKEERVRRDELIAAVLQRALHLFHVRDRQHVYGLFKAATGGSPIPDNITVHAAGVEKGMELFLREKQVQGG